jgi:NifU-like protein
MWDYSDKVRDHYLNPRNAGEIENPDGFGEIGNVTCGDALRLTFKLDKEGKVADIRFKTFGCGSAIASASVLTEMCKGKTLEEIKKITNNDIAKELDGLPKEKMHCSVMGQEALEAAINYYESGGKVTIPKSKEGAIVCHCFNVTDKEIEDAVRNNHLNTIEEVTNYTKAGGACGNCHEKIQKIIDTIRENKTGEPEKKSLKMTMLQKIDKIRETLKNNVAPILAQDGGNCELVDVDGDIVYIQLVGHCSGCAFSNMTLISVVQKTLREKVSENIVVKLQE